LKFTLARLRALQVQRLGKHRGFWQDHQVLSLIFGFWFVAGVIQAPEGSPAPRAVFIDVAGVRLQYLDWGGSGEPIILVPGGCETPYVFDDLARLLAAHARVLALTPRGCGRSGLATDGYAIDHQILELIGFMDALSLERATFGGHSSGGGKVVRLARLFPSRVRRLVAFDIGYRGVPDGFEQKMEAAIASQIGPTSGLSLSAHRRTFQAWELGAWSAALEQDFHERTEVSANGGLRYRQRPPEWQKAFVGDLQVGRYFETAISHSALLFVSEDLDFERIRQFSQDQQRELRPMAEAVAKARRIQVESYERNGPHVRVVRMRNTSHYPFVDRTREVATRMLEFLRSNE
jgi:pimeloyl-ACP methyl ester carboxylesterase